WSSDVCSSDLGFQCTLDIVRQSNYRFLRLYRFNGALNDSTFVIFGNVGGERILLQLLDAQGDALALRVDGQNHCLDLVTFLEFTHSFFAGLVPRNVRQVNQAINTTIEADKDTEISNGFDFAGDLVALGV